ncbi:MULTISPECIES: heavy-metal-associated domain-containing protein [Enterococcus]|uniref:heavy-metal-associated domain-containing protein n=1 Tax=Enterococcus TaxID=1350 RepID=UPI0018A0E1BB|nr:cation transporter [Enterococcus dispar]WCG34031.1 cation transporter [Enterococcus dispar]
MVKVIIQLGALTCPSCLQKIESAVSKEAGVKKVKVLFNASKVKAEIDTSQTTGEILAKTIEKLGYEVQSVKVKEA